MQTDFGVGFKQYLKEEFQIEAVVNLDDQEGRLRRKDDG